MASPLQTLSLQIFGIGTGFVTAGAVVALSYSTIPIFVSHPNEVSLQHLRALFSSGSHIFPQLATASSAAFSALAYYAPAGSSLRSQYIVAAAWTIGIAPFTLFIMKPTNMTLKQIGEQGDEGIKKSGGEQRVQELLYRFSRLNVVRGGLLAFGAGLGLYAALSH
ncbi:MAG: hypothetical protein Q9174_002631 [Haloplaca sp. 1 TL-2023]